MNHLRAAGRALASISIAFVPTLASSSVPYVVVDGSTYQEGCFAPCACPMLIQAPLSGTFQLDLVGPGNVFDFYAVSDVRWFASNASLARRITGDGIYKVGELTTQQDLELDLSINQNIPEHFSSGTVDTTVRFPDIAVTISKHGGVCQDTVMGLRARPTPRLALERDALVWDTGLEIPRITAAVRTGDTTSSERAAMLRTPPHILVTTPESLYLLLTAERSRNMLRSVRTVIVDEIHAVIGTRRGAHLSLTLERLQHVAARPLLRLGLSATQKPIEDVAKWLVKNHFLAAN